VWDICQELPHVKIIDFGVNQAQVLLAPKMEKEKCHHPPIPTDTPNVGTIHVFLPSSVTFVFYVFQWLYMIFCILIMSFCYILNVVHVVMPIFLGDFQFVNNENMSHGQSSTKVTPLEHVALTTSWLKVKSKARYFFMKQKIVDTSSNDLPPRKKGFISKIFTMAS
jgi:hypothetical protein